MGCGGESQGRQNKWWAASWAWWPGAWHCNGTEERGWNCQTPKRFITRNSKAHATSFGPMWLTPFLLINSVKFCFSLCKPKCLTISLKNFLDISCKMYIYYQLISFAFTYQMKYCSFLVEELCHEAQNSGLVEFFSNPLKNSPYCFFQCIFS